MSDVTFSAKAYCKLILHAVKYPYCAVNGILLSKSSTKSKEIEIVDAVPLFHISVNLTPMSEIALMQIDEMAAQRGLVICGYYLALENAADSSFEKAYNRISDKLTTIHPAPCLVLVDNRKLNLQMDNVALKLAQFADGSYKVPGNQRISLKPDASLEICAQLVEGSSHNILVDFDNHLDNISLDWLNPRLNEEIDNLVSRFK